MLNAPLPFSPNPYFVSSEVTFVSVPAFTTTSSASSPRFSCQTLSWYEPGSPSLVVRLSEKENALRAVLRPRRRQSFLMRQTIVPQVGARGVAIPGFIFTTPKTGHEYPPPWEECHATGFLWVSSSTTLFAAVNHRRHPRSVYTSTNRSGWGRPCTGTGCRRGFSKPHHPSEPCREHCSVDRAWFDPESPL